MSHPVIPIIERNSLVGPAIASCLTHLEEKLEKRGFAAKLLIMQSNGGVLGVAETGGIGLPAIALLMLGAWTDASACLYSGSLSLTNEVERFRLPWVTVSSAAIGCVFAIYHAERIFMPFLAVGIAITANRSIAF